MMSDYNQFKIPKGKTVTMAEQLLGRWLDLPDAVGNIPIEITGMEKGSNLIKIKFQNGMTLVFEHAQECCEVVDIDDIVGDPKDLLNTPLLLIEESQSPMLNRKTLFDSLGYESCTWTFYRFASVKGYVDVRWMGSSNGYYSESVDYYFV